VSKQVSNNKQLIIAAMGIGSAVVTGGILGLFEASTGITLYSFMFFFIIPLGAFFAGVMSASGYYFGAITFHQKPAGGVALNMVLVAIGAYLLAHYIPYNAMIIDGIQVKEKISFFQYLDLDIRHTTLSIKGHNTGELGSFGYIYALLQLIGFSVGGLCVFAFLLDIPFCQQCSEYLTKVKTQDRYTSEGEALFENVETFVKNLDEKKYRAAIKIHTDLMGSVEQTEHHLRTRITIHKCQTCEINHLNFEAAHLDSGDWKNIDKSQIKLWIDPRLDATVRETSST
jgi:DNA-directed RNA polymerase subunit M/transcription elongation factor TFIIS